MKWHVRGVVGGQNKEEEEKKQERKGKKRKPKGRWGKGETRGTCVLNMWREKTIRSACFIFMCSHYYITQERYNKAYKWVVRSPKWIQIKYLFLLKRWSLLLTSIWRVLLFFMSKTLWVLFSSEAVEAVTNVTET